MLALPRRVRKEIRIGPCRVGALAGSRNRKKIHPQIISNSPRSSIKPISAPDPIIYRNESLLINFKNIIDYIFWLAELTEKM